MIININPKEFYKRVKKTKKCWIWKGAKTKGGYGVLKLNGICVYAHRLSLTFKVKLIPTNKLALHTCDNPSCVNPNHLRVGTWSENIQDQYQRNRRRKSKQLRRKV